MSAHLLLCWPMSVCPADHAISSSNSSVRSRSFLRAAAALGKYLYRIPLDNQLGFPG